MQNVLHLSKIRNKIAIFTNIDIETVRGVGYRGIKNEAEEKV